MPRLLRLLELLGDDSLDPDTLDLLLELLIPILLRLLLGDESLLESELLLVPRLLRLLSEDSLDSELGLLELGLLSEESLLGLLDD